jgi:multiple sugar transport system substrate-binding protein
MKYRTVPVYPQVDKQIDIAISSIATAQLSAKEAMAAAQRNSISELQRAGVKL